MIPNSIKRWKILIAIGIIISCVMVGFFVFGNKLSADVQPPEILNFSILPNKPVSGNMVTIEVDVQDEKGIKKVTAEVFHEIGSDKIEMSLISGDIRNGRWQGKWGAHDITVKEYDVIITAYSKSGLSTSKTFKYLDPGWLAWLSGWTYRKRITIDETKVDADLTDFPVLVKLTSSNFDFSKAKSNGYDIRFTSSDGTTLLKYERERYSAGANTIFEDNFNSYNDGNLVGQGNWIAGTWQVILATVQGTVVYEGAKAVKWDGDGANQVYKVGNQVADGRATVYMRKGSNSAGNLYVTFCEDVWTAQKAGVQFANDGNIYLINTPIGTYIANQWYQIEIEWRSSDKYWRARIDGGAWSSWMAGWSAFTNYVNIVRLQCDNDGAYQSYVDYIAENPINENKAEYHVKVPAVSGTANTDFYMYYGNSSAADGADPTAVWDTNYKAVYHLKESSGTVCSDSTVNANNATYEGTLPDQIDAKIGKGQNYVPADVDRISLPTWTYGSIGTIEIWFKADDTASNHWGIIFDDATGANTTGIQVNTNTIRWMYYGGGSYQADYSEAFTDITNWHYGAYSFQTNEFKAYKDDVNVNTDTVGTTANVSFTRADIGAYHDTSFTWDGILDEVRISTAVRSAAWLKASYNSGNDSLVSYGSEETGETGWKYRKKITIDETKVDANLTDFPVLVKLTSTNFDFSKALSTGNDIRFTASDGTTLLKYERERHDSTNSLAEYHVKVPSVSGTANTDIYMYYGNSSAADGADPTNVWDANFKAVYHLKEDPTGTAPQMKDSTAGVYHGTTANMVTANSIEAKINKGIELIDDNDYIDAGTNPFGGMDFINSTMEVWVKTDIFGASQFIIGDYPATPTGQPWIAIVDNNDPSNQFYTYYRNAAGGGSVQVFSDTVTTGVWYHMVATADGTNVRLYRDGALVGGPTSGLTGTYNATNYHWRMGARSYDNLVAHDGPIDEVRVSNIARSAAWLKASYNSGNDSLVSYGTEETSRIPAPPGISPSGGGFLIF